MAFLNISGISGIRVNPASAKERQPVRVGSSTRAYNGALRSTVRVLKKEYECDTALMTAADVATLRSVTELGQQVTCSGDWLNGEATYEVQTTAVVPVQTGAGIRYRMSLVLMRV